MPKGGKMATPKKEERKYICTNPSCPGTVMAEEMPKECPVCKKEMFDISKAWKEAQKRISELKEKNDQEEKEKAAIKAKLYDQQSEKRKLKKAVNWISLGTIIIFITFLIINRVEMKKVKTFSVEKVNLTAEVKKVKESNEKLSQSKKDFEKKSNKLQNLLIQEKEKNDYLQISEKFVEIGFRMIPNKMIEKKISKLEFDEKSQIKDFIKRNADYHCLATLYRDMGEGKSYTESHLQKFFSKIFLTPKNVKIFWKAKKNVIINSLRKREDADKILESFKLALQPNQKILDLYSTKNSESQNWEELYKLKEVGDVGLTTTWIRHKARMEKAEEGSSKKMKKTLNSIIEEIEKNL
jgi:hypothetical protein